MARPLTPTIIKFDGEMDEQPSLGGDQAHGAIVQNLFLAKDHKLVRRLGSSRWSDGFSSDEFRALKYVLLTRGGAAGFASASTQYLRSATNSTLETGNIDFSFGGWFKLTTLGADRFLMGKWDRTTLGNREYGLYYDATFTQRLVFGVTSAANDIGGVTATTFGVPPLDTWFFVSCYHDSVNNVVGISVNGGTRDTASFTFGVAARSTDFQIGASDDLTMLHNGGADECFLIKRVITTTEEDDFYNVGTGVTYENLTTAHKVSLVSWWKLNEATGATRLDSHGTNHLTDTNNVTLIAGKR